MVKLKKIDKKYKSVQVDQYWHEAWRLLGICVECGHEQKFPTKKICERCGFNNDKNIESILRELIKKLSSVLDYTFEETKKFVAITMLDALKEVEGKPKGSE